MEENFEDAEKKPRVVRYSKIFKYLPMRVQALSPLPNGNKKQRKSRLSRDKKQLLKKVYLYNNYMLF
ncbi:hypothetical protein CW304_21135 [Bacillus sp. UFRGS-B20]|nr:hypothetical protein CW304_21135 [Bacillus sp. UFRGS-B20]